MCLPSARLNLELLRFFDPWHLLTIGSLLSSRMMACLRLFDPWHVLTIGGLLSSRMMACDRRFAAAHRSFWSRCRYCFPGRVGADNHGHRWQDYSRRHGQAQGSVGMTSLFIGVLGVANWNVAHDP